ncbi:delta(3,5)-Delta(2,4)-dienoyl-CoA isomerase, mitochondrial isoform X3 [Diachasma alloeum]|uniref:delta(3,5)-Delta(2,4)-dienoyl-CoA isomerase, mitochondrial isoform X3 n=1 Tax=Diachasma alloeum TaxID=454923 RepID=UPI0007384D1C|nr:delta(3,5)-Delta(2,4)-dienoyl-CoA isomerase, mitochondrial isoform X3 [Diachasma alloeum]
MYPSIGIGRSLLKVIKPLQNFRNISAMSSFNFDTISVSSPNEFVYKVQLNRPNKMNALNNAMWINLQCRKPVIAAIHGLCIGGGFNMVCGADIRYCSTNAWFTLKEVDLGMAADVGALQWFPKNIGSSSLVREIAFTGRKMQADEALQCGFVSRLFQDDESLWTETLKLAEEISQKSPVAVQNTKKTLVYSSDHTVQEGLDYVRNLNQAMLQSEDFVKAAVAIASKGERPSFSKL